MKTKWADYFNQEARNLKRNEYGNKIPKLTAIDFAVYAILRGKDPMKGLNNAKDGNWGTPLFHIKRYARHIGMDERQFFIDKHCKEFYGISQETVQKLGEVMKRMFLNDEPFEDVMKDFTFVDEVEPIESLA